MWHALTSFFLRLTIATAAWSRDFRAQLLIVDFAAIGLMSSTFLGELGGGQRLSLKSEMFPMRRAAAARHQPTDPVQMIYGNSEDRQHTMLAKNAAQAFAKTAAGEIQPSPPILSPAVANYSNCDRAGFVIVDWQRQSSLNRLIPVLSDSADGHWFMVCVKAVQSQCGMPFADAERRGTGLIMASLCRTAQAGNHFI